MDTIETAAGVFPDHDIAEGAVKTLNAAGFEMRTLSVVGKGYHSEEKVVGFYDTGDRITFWGPRGAFWGPFFGGLFIATPVSEPIFTVGFLAAIAATAIENAVVVGGLSALGAALHSVGIPKDSVLAYESDVKADSLLVMARGSASEDGKAKRILNASHPSPVQIYGGGLPSGAEQIPAHAAA